MPPRRPTFSMRAWPKPGTEPSPPTPMTEAKLSRAWEYLVGVKPSCCRLVRHPLPLGSRLVPVTAEILLNDPVHAKPHHHRYTHSLRCGLEFPAINSRLNRNCKVFGSGLTSWCFRARPLFTRFAVHSFFPIALCPVRVKEYFPDPLFSMTPAAPTLSHLPSLQRLPRPQCVCESSPSPCSRASRNDGRTPFAYFSPPATFAPIYPDPGVCRNTRSPGRFLFPQTSIKSRFAFTDRRVRTSAAVHSGGIAGRGTLGVDRDYQVPSSVPQISGSPSIPSVFQFFQSNSVSVCFSRSFFAAS